MKFPENDKLAKLLVSFAGPRATSPVNGLLILGLLSAGSFVTESNYAFEDAPPIVDGAFLSFFVSFSFYLIFGYLISRFTPNINNLRILLLVLLFALTEVIRTFSIAYFELHFTVITQIDWDYRVSAGAASGIIFFGLAAVVANDNFTNRQKLAELREVRNKLEETSAVSEKVLAENKSKIIATIRDAVNQALHAVVNQSQDNKQNTKLVVEELIRVSDEVVRPLSHQLFDESLQIPKSAHADLKRKIFSRQFLQYASTAEPFHPGLTSALAMIQLAPVALFFTNNPIKGLYAVLEFSVWIYLVYFAARKFVKPLLPKLNIYLRFILITLIFALMGSFIGLVSDFAISLNFPVGNEILLYIMFLGVVFGWSLAFYSGIQASRSATLSELSEINEKLSWAAARLGSRLWAEQKTLASIIHRDIQGALISSALKFKKDVDEGKDSNIAIEQIREFVQGTTELINNPVESVEVSKNVSSLNNLWENIFEMTLDVNQETLGRINADPICQQSVNDFISEFATNSVKHGKSTHGEIQIQTPESNLLKLTMVNDGLPLGQNLKHGLGSQMALKQSLFIDHRNLADGGVLFEVIIPIT